MNRQYFISGVAALALTLSSTNLWAGCSQTVSGEVQPLAELQEDNSKEEEQLLTALQSGGHVIYFRHAEKGQSSETVSNLPPQFESCLFPNVPLTTVGASSMRSLGQQFQQLHLPVGEVISSPVCRCIESAWLSFGKASIDTSLNGVYDKDRQGEFIINTAVTEKLATNLRRALVDVPEPGLNTVLFAHSSNILALTGLHLKEGEAAIFKPDGQGHFTYVRRLKLDEWRTLVP